MENLPPFYVGQRVVAIDDGLHSIDGSVVIKRGEVFTVLGVVFCGCRWRVDVGKKASYISKSVCRHCRGLYQPNGSVMYVAARMLAPINENFQSISLEKVLETETPLISVN